MATVIALCLAIGACDEEEPGSGIPFAGCVASTSVPIHAICPGDKDYVKPVTPPKPNATTTTSTSGPMATPTTIAAAITTVATDLSGDAYLAIRAYYDLALHEIEPDLANPDLRVYCDEAASIDGQFAPAVAAATWSAAAQPSIDALVAATTAKQVIEQGCAAAPSSSAAVTVWNAPSTIDAHQAALAADVTLRQTLGLPAPTG